MRYMLILLYTILITLLCIVGANRVLADEWSVRFGPSIQNGSPDGSSKVFGVRNESRLLGPAHSAYELGGYVDNGGNGRKSAGVAKAQIGVKPVGQSGFYGFAFVGPSVITATDTVLGSIPQFATDIGFGIRDINSSMSLGYSHLSNAGIFSGPNKGRDFLVFSAAIFL